jgi:hypothetical protein
MDYSSIRLGGYVPDHACAKAIKAHVEQAKDLHRGGLWGERRGKAPLGYLHGMAVMYARAYCQLVLSKIPLVAMTYPTTVRNASARPPSVKKDAIRSYEKQLTSLGLNVKEDGVDVLRALYLLMVGLGMRESSGRYCEGWDKGKLTGWNGKYPPKKPTANNSEAGLFQLSYDGGVARIEELKSMQRRYSGLPNDGLLDIFKVGVTPTKADASYGTGPGAHFQDLSKNAPAMTVEMTAYLLRSNAGHWGPINSGTAVVRPELLDLFRAVEQCVIQENGAEILLW